MANAEILFYSCYKRLNSTAIPKYDDDWLFTLQGDFKMPYDVLHPVVIVEDPATTATHYGTTFSVGTAPNYAFIRKYPYTSETPYRAYWITDIVWVSEKLVEVHFSVDVLGSYQSRIFTSEQYVLRSSKKQDGQINDAQYPMYSRESSAGVDIGTSVPWHMATPWLANGIFVVGIVNDDANAYGGVSYYMFDCMSYNELRKQLLSTVSWTNMQFTDIEQSLYKSLFNPMQYIYSVMWFPMGVIDSLWNDTSNILQHTLHFGWWDNITIDDPGGLVDIGFKPLLACYDSGSFNLSARHHTYSTTRGEYLNCPPWFNRVLYMPPFDSIELNTAGISTGADYPVVYWRVDFITGEGSVRVQSNAQSGTVIGAKSCQLGVPMVIAQATQDMIGAVGGLTQTGAGIGMLAAGAAMSISGGSGGGAMQAGFSNAMSGAQTLANSIMPQITTEGMQASIGAFGMQCLDVIISKFPPDEDNDRFGRPYCKKIKLNTLSTGAPYGYVVCANAQVEWDGILLEEKQAIMNYLNTGVFLEQYPPTLSP